MEKTRSVREEMDGKVFISRQSRHLFPLINNTIKIIFPICTLIWRVNNYVSRQGKEKYKQEKWKYKEYYKLLRLLSVAILQNTTFWLFLLLELYPSDLEETPYH